MIDDRDLVFKQIKRPDSGCVTYLVGSRKTKECAIIDPLLDVDFTINEAHNEGFDRITHVIDTHTHADHISGARSIAKKFGLPGVIMHSSTKCSFPTVGVDDLQSISIGDTKLTILYTPGHTLDHICILVNNEKLLTGDTMMIGDVGRIDLGGDQKEKTEKLFHSLHQKLMKLEDDVQVYPTHVGATHHLGSANTSSKIGKERADNSALKPKTVEEFYKYMTEDWPPKPPDFQNIIRINSSDDWIYGFMTDDAVNRYLAAKSQNK